MVEAIEDDDELYRRIVRNHLDSDGRVTSNAYKRNGKPDPSVSVDLARLTSIAESAARGAKPGTGIGVLVAAAPRELKLSVHHSPADSNSAHCSIETLTTKEHCRRLAEATTVRLPPTDT